MKRTAFPLRLGAAAWAAVIVLAAVVEALRTSAYAALHRGDPGVDSHAVHARLALLATIQTVTYLALSVTLAVAVALFAAALSRSRARTVGWIAFGLLVSGVVMSVALTLLVRSGSFASSGEPGSLRLLNLLWLSRSLLGTAALGALLLAIALAVGRRATAGWSMLAVYGCLAAGSFGWLTLELLRQSASATSEVMIWIYRVLDYGSDAVTTGAMLWGASRLGREPDPSPADGEPAGDEGRQAVSGAPLRQLAAILLWRIVTGVIGQILLVGVMASGSFESAQPLVVLLGMLSLVLTVLLCTGLGRYLRMPEPARHGGALGVALAALGLAAAVDLYATVSAVQLFGLVAEARRATSFWGMPSLSHIEELQAGLEWGGRIAMVLGVGAALGLLASLRTTASWVGDRAQQVRVRTLLVLTSVGGIGAVALGAAIGAGMKQDTLMLVLLGIGPILLGVGIAALVGWMRLLRGLADSLERGPRPEREPPVIRELPDA
jgi:hypothetical protein